MDGYKRILHKTQELEKAVSRLYQIITKQEMKLYLLIQKEVSRPRENIEIDPITCKRIFCNKEGFIQIRVKGSIIL